MLVLLTQLARCARIAAHILFLFGDNLGLVFGLGFLIEKLFAVLIQSVELGFEFLELDQVLEWRML